MHGNDNMSDSMRLLVEVSDFAHERGLVGVMILSPICPGCGEAHSFEMVTDLGVKGPDDIHQGLRDLLLRFADVAMTAPAETADTTPPGLQ